MYAMVIKRSFLQLLLLLLLLLTTAFVLAVHDQRVLESSPRDRDVALPALLHMIIV